MRWGADMHRTPQGAAAHLNICNAQVVAQRLPRRRALARHVGGAGPPWVRGPPAAQPPRRRLVVVLLLLQRGGQPLLVLARLHRAQHALHLRPAPQAPQRTLVRCCMVKVLMQTLRRAP